MIILGDFNLHFDEDTADVLSIKRTLVEQKMVQHVQKPTHKKKHILGWVVTNDTITLLSPVNVIDKLLSDHYPFHFDIQASKPSFNKKIIITSRNIKKISIEELKIDLKLELERSGTKDIESFNNTLVHALDRHAPEKTRTVNERKNPCPWFNVDVKNAKKEKRRAEAKWNKSGLVIHKEMYTVQKKKYKDLCNAAKRQYYDSKFREIKNSKDFFRLTDDLLGKEKSTALPTQFEKDQLPETFSEYFKGKIETIRKELDKTPIFVDDSSFTGFQFDSFDNISESDVQNVIMSSSSKFCDLDPFPTHLLKQCLDVILPVLTEILNDSLKSGIVPNIFKIAHVKPLLKRSNLDPDQLKNFRPVSNLPFLSNLF